MAPRDPWSDVPETVKRIELLTRHGMTVADIRGNLKTGRVSAPTTATGDRQAWTAALVSAGQEYIRRRARSEAPPVAPTSPATGDEEAPDDLRLAVLALIDRLVLDQSKMTPGEWTTYIRSPEGKAATRQMLALSTMMQGRTALADGSTASAPKIAEIVAKLTDSMSATDDVAADPAGAVRDVESACMAVLDMLPTVAAFVGLDTVLRALRLRDRHVEPSP